MFVNRPRAIGESRQGRVRIFVKNLPSKNEFSGGEIKLRQCLERLISKYFILI
jgi:hypothetical protein